MWFVLLIIIVLAVGPSSCFEDSNYVPYFMKGLDVWVYDHVSQNNLYGGRIEATWFSSKRALADCNIMAERTAAYNHLKDWSYVCCTVTAANSCSTKIR